MYCPERGGSNDYPSPELEVKILVDRDPLKKSFVEWARPGHGSKTIAKGPETTPWIWNLHRFGGDLLKIFNAHFGQLSIIFLWLSGVGGGFRGIQITSGCSKFGMVPRCRIYVEYHLAGLLGLRSLLWVGNQVHKNWGIGRGRKDILEAHKGSFTIKGHKGLYEILTTSSHAQLSLKLAMFGSLTIVVAHHMCSMPPYPYLAGDYDIGDTIISHLNWACIFLGFHRFGFYIHNDTMSTLGILKICFQIPLYNSNLFLFNGYRTPMLQCLVQQLQVQQQAQV
ncbi:hypothetical protein RDABS01_032146 [Bienertia sinuspersici]